MVYDVKQLELHVTHACNFTCEGCSHYSNHGHTGNISLDDCEEWLYGWSKRVKPKTLTISDVFSLWSADIGLQKKSRKFDLRMFEGVLKPHFQDQDLTHIKYSDLREFHTQLTTENGPYRANRVTMVNYPIFPFPIE